MQTLNIKQRLNLINRGLDIAPTIKDYNRILLQTDSVSEIDTVLKELSLKNIPTNTQTKNTLMKQYFKFKKPFESIQIFEHLTSKNKQTSTTFDILLNGLNMLELHDLGLDYIKIMNKGGYQSRISIMIWMDLLAKKKDYKALMEVLDMVLLKQSGMKMEELLMKYGENTDTKEPRTETDESSLKELKPVSNISTVDLAKDQDVFDPTVELIRQAAENEPTHKTDIYLDIHMCSTLLTSFQSQPELVKKLLKLMKIFRIQKTQRFYEILLNYECVEGKVEYAFDIIQQLQSKGKSLQSHSDKEQSNILGIYLTNVSHFNLLKGCFKQNKPEKALEYIQALQRQGVQVSLAMYIICLQGFKQQKLYSEFFDLFDLVTDLPQAPLLVYNLAMKYALEENDFLRFEGVKKHLGKMSKNKETFEMELEMYTKLRDVTNAIETLEAMETQKIDIDIGKVLRLIKVTKGIKEFRGLLKFIRENPYKFLKAPRNTGKRLLIPKATPEPDSELLEIIQDIKPEFEKMVTQILNEKTKFDTISIKIIYENYYKTQPNSQQFLASMMEIYASQNDLINVVKTWESLSKSYTPTSHELLILLKTVREFGQDRTNQAIIKLVKNNQNTYTLDKKCFEEFFYIIGKYGDYEDLVDFYFEYRDVIGTGSDLGYAMVMEGIEGRSDKVFKNLFRDRLEVFFQEFFPESMVIPE
jgi:pentatricopeptide repeat protein